MLFALSRPAEAWSDPNAAPNDPVLSLHYTLSQIAFEKAPQYLLGACTQPRFGAMWILAETQRPEGDYMLISGPIWVDPDLPEGGPHKLVLEYDGNGEIVLLSKSGVCRGLWDPDNAFGAFFPGNKDNQPTRSERSIVRDLGVDLIRRAERAFGGKAAFLRALDATGFKDCKQDIVMQPLLKGIRDSSEK